MTIYVAQEIPAHMSNSQFEDFMDCGWKYALGRVFRIPRKPGLALVGGSAFHLVTELIDHQIEVRKLSQAGMVELPLEHESTESSRAKANSMTRLLSQVVEEVDWTQVDLENPRIDDAIADAWHLAFSASCLAEMGTNELYPDPKDWETAGRSSKAMPDGEDLAWWTAQGATQLRDYLVWRRTSGWELAFFGGKPMIELDVAATVGSVAFQGYIDRIMIDPHGVVHVVDLKTGRSEPTSSTQLGLYKVLLESLGMPSPTYGAYFMTRNALPGRSRNLTRYTPDFFDWQFGKIQQQRNRGEFIANDKSQYCYRCPYRDFCFAVGGEQSHELPKPWQLEPPKVKLPLTVA